MSTTATELERLVVRIVGDGGNYNKILTGAVANTQASAVKIGTYARSMSEMQSLAMAEAARVTQAVMTPTQRYRQELARVNDLHRMGALTAGVHSRAIRQLQQEYAKGTYAVKAFGQGVAAAGARMRGFGMLATFTTTLPVLGMVRSWGKFDDAMTKSTAIMKGVTAELRKEMERTAYSISSKSETSATDLAKSYFYLASAGMNVQQAIKALPAMEQFATAGAFDMATATSLAADAQSALGLTAKDADKNLQGLVKVTDILLKANTLANANTQQFSEALTNEAGPAIKSYNMSLEEGVAILATYADQGIKGNVAGSMMSRMVRLLIQSINENGAMFRKLNIDVGEFSKTGKNVTKVIEGITRAVDGMGPAQKAATLEALGFQARVQAAILPLLGATEKIRGYQAELEKAGGTTASVADYQLTSFSSQMKVLWNNIVIVGQEIGRTLAPYIQRLGDYVRNLTVWWRGLDDKTKGYIAVAAGLVAALGPVLTVLGSIFVAGGGFISVLGALMSTSLGFIPIAGAVAAAIWGIYSIVNDTDSGFRDLTDRVMISGYSMSAWMDATAAAIQMAWDDLVTNLQLAWEGFVAYGEEGMAKIWRGVLYAAQGIVTAFWWAVDKVASGITYLMQQSIELLNYLGVVGDEAVAGMRAAIDSAKANIKNAGKEAGDYYQQYIDESLNNSEKRWREHADKIANINRAGADKTKFWEGAMKNIFEGDITKQAERKKLAKPTVEVPEVKIPEVEVPKVKMPEQPNEFDLGEKNKKETGFQQISSLSRISIAGLAGFGPAKEQSVKAVGIEKRLDALIGIAKQKHGFVLSE